MKCEFFHATVKTIVQLKLYFKVSNLITKVSN